MGGGELKWFQPYTLSGRRLTRHESGYGSVLEYQDFDHQIKRVLILDAKYRTAAKFGAQGNSVSLRSYTNYYNLLGNNYIYGNLARRKSITDKRFSGIWSGSNLDTNSSRYNCDVWMQYANSYESNPVLNQPAVYGVPAVQHCRNIYVPSINKYADLPCESVLMHIAVEADYIDRLDPTVGVDGDGNYNTYALGSRNPNGRGIFSGADVSGANGASYWWTSTNYSGMESVAISTNKYMTYAGKSRWTLAVIPVIDLD